MVQLGRSGDQGIKRDIHEINVIYFHAIVLLKQLTHIHAEDLVVAQST